MKKLVEEIAKALVDIPEQVSVNEIKSIGYAYNPQIC